MIPNKQSARPVRLAGIALAAVAVLGGCRALGQTEETWSAESAELVFVSNRDGAKLDIYLHTLGTESLIRVTSDTSNDFSPVWSPDGERILFESDATGNWEMVVMNADGSARTNLTNSEGYDGGGDFSPDGSEIVFTSSRDARAPRLSGRDIWLMRADGSNLRRLTTNDTYEAAPRFSPDGTRIVFCRALLPEEEGGERNGEIFVMDRDGGNEQRITDHDGFDCLAHWSPDGIRLAYHRCGEDGCFLYVAPADGGEPTKLETNHQGYWPVWSPDGEWLAYTASQDDQTDIWLIRPDGSENRRVTTHPGRDEVAAWRPVR